MSGVFGGDASFRAALLANQLETFLRAEDESRGRKDSGHDAIGRDHAHGLAAVTDRQPGSGIEDVPVTALTELERAEIIAGAGDRLIGQSKRGPTFARSVRFFEPDVPGVFSGRTAGDANVLTDVDHHIRYLELAGH